jgi:hypothetical protein
MTPEYESVVLHTFCSFLEHGFVYKGLRSVCWCIFDKTALAEAEVECGTTSVHRVGKIMRWRTIPLPSTPLCAVRKFSPSSGPRRPGRCPPPWQSPSIPMKSTLRSNPAAKSTSWAQSWQRM